MSSNKLTEVSKLIEYNGDFYTAEELVELGVTSDFDVTVKDENDTWFGNIMSVVRSKTETKQ